MKTTTVLVIAGMLICGTAFAIGGRGGGGGGIRAGGGGGNFARPAAPNVTPSFSGPVNRPAAPVARPNPPQITRPAAPGNAISRPGMVPGSRPNLPSPAVIHPNNPGIQAPKLAGPVNRPNLPSPKTIFPNNPNRPTTLPAGPIAGGQLPNRPPINPKNFPGGGLQPPVIQPPVNRPPIVNNPNVGNKVNNPYAGNFNKGNINNVNVNNSINRVGNNNFANVNNRPWNGVGARPLPYPPPYRPNWGHWNQGYWNSWNYRPGVWLGAGTAFGWLLSPGQNVAYANPYYLAPPPTQVVYDYSQPIVMTGPVDDGSPTDVPIPADALPPVQPGEPMNIPPTDEKNDEAVRNFDAARAAFKAKDFARALDLVNAAIKLQPSDGSLHEFRGLVLFATKEYQQSAATEYSVLAAGPGWNWDTVKSLYDSSTTYAQQLRDLETFQKANPTLGYASFLLAYHYLMLDSVPQAITQLENAVTRTPGDELSKLLLKSLKDQNDRPLPATP